MSRKEKLFLLAIIILVLLVGREIIKKEPARPVLVKEPVQVMLDESQKVSYHTKSGMIELELIAVYTVSGVIKSKKNYSMDPASVVSPMDLVIAWGTLNRKGIDEGIAYTQFNRWYSYKYKSGSAASLISIGRMSANIHIIPADKNIQKALGKIRIGDYIELSGYLVNVYFGQGMSAWRSSLTREDSGDGACEIMYVTKIDTPGKE